MNERIKQLAKEAGFYANPDIEKFEKFAELIVQECCQFENSYSGEAGLVARHYSRRIREHFGVEQ